MKNTVTVELKCSTLLIPNLPLRTIFHNLLPPRSVLVSYPSQCCKWFLQQNFKHISRLPYPSYMCSLS